MTNEEKTENIISKYETKYNETSDLLRNRNMAKEDIINFIRMIIEDDYSGMTLSSSLWELFGKRDEAIKAYIKEGREFWHYDGNKGCYRKLKITYVRSGVMFFIFKDEPNKEHAWFINSFNCNSMFAAQIYPNEIGDILSKWTEYADMDFSKIAKQCKWYDCNGKITVEVISDK